MGDRFRMCWAPRRRSMMRFSERWRGVARGLFLAAVLFGSVGGLFWIGYSSARVPAARNDGWPPSAGERRENAERVEREMRERRAAPRGGGLPRVQTSFTSEQEGLLRAMLNLNGHLCAEVVEMRRLQVEKQVEVTCVRYRGGSARASYVLDTVSGRAFEQ